MLPRLPMDKNTYDNVAYRNEGATMRLMRPKRYTLSQWGVGTQRMCFRKNVFSSTIYGKKHQNSGYIQQSVFNFNLRPLMPCVKLYSKSLCSLQSSDLLNAKDLWDMTYPKSKHGMGPLAREDPQQDHRNPFPTKYRNGSTPISISQRIASKIRPSQLEMPHSHIVHFIWVG